MTVIFKGKMEAATIRRCRRIAVASLCATLGVLMGAWRAHAQRLSSWSVVDPADDSVVAWEGGEVERCALDELHVRVEAQLKASELWTHAERAEHSMDGRAAVPLEVVRADADADGSVVHVGEITLITRATPADTPEEVETPVSPIECAFDAEFCVPRIVGIRLPDAVEGVDALRVNHSIILLFADATSRPLAATRDDIESFVALPTYVGDELHGVWTDDKTLTIVVKAVDESRLLPLQELMTALVHTKLQVDEHKATRALDRLLRVAGSVRLRVEPVGLFRLRVILSTEVVTSPIIRVRDCTQATDSTVVVLTDSVTPASQADMKLPPPSVFIDGVLSHSGAEGLTLRHSEIGMRHGERPGSWSLNFWLFTNQDATGSFRTLLFNGDGSGQQRTPSAWFRPHDRRLVLRVSTTTENDVGLDSNREIPLNEWVNIGFSFLNCSTGVDPANATIQPECLALEAQKDRPWFYAIKLFVNGIIDQEVRIFAPVQPNSGPLHLAKGPWTDGFQGFTSQLLVYGDVVEDNVHQSLYRQGIRSGLYKMLSTSDMCHTFRSAKRLQSQNAPKVTQQIALLLQCAPAQRGHDTPAEAVIATSSSPSSTYDTFRERLRTCDLGALDLLAESAEQGDPRAVRDMGISLLYGRVAFPESCATSKVDGIRVPIDPLRARDLLAQALQLKEWSAARYLPLAEEVARFESDASSNDWRHLQLGLLHIAAVAGRSDAFVILGQLYNEGSEFKNADVSAFHYFHAARDASAEYHARGKQPLHEMNRLYDGIDEEDELRKGQLGDDDELIQYQQMRADKDGDVAAMANMGDLYYWGARGVERDHERAYQYFERAAQNGHTGAQSAVAGMLLKGEGTAQNNVSAVAWYEKAASKSHTRALNGLGFIYFHGSGGVEENKSLALEYFERAAANMEDGDSVFNAGYCHAFGLGTQSNITRAIQYYSTAARRFGHFDAIYELGKIYWHGWQDTDSSIEVVRDSTQAITYVKAASDAGAWGKSVRLGFELYLTGQFERAAIVYHEAMQYGYKVATSNLAFLYDQKLLQLGDRSSELRTLEYLRLSAQRNGDKEVLVRIGDFHFYGLAGLPRNAALALRWYSRASAEGVEAGAYNVGSMYEYGYGGVSVNYERAERYYRRVLELASPRAIDKYAVVQLALWRLRWKTWMNLADLSLPLEREGSTWASVSVGVAVVVAAVGAWFMRKHRASVD